MTTNTQPEAIPGTGWQDQTFLVGEQVYLRSIQPGDEKNAGSWRSSVFPKSPEMMETWIKEELPKAGKNHMAYLVIVRKSDDVVVGSIPSWHGDIGVRLFPYVDVLYGEMGQRWLAEAIRLHARWEVDERFKPVADVELAANLEVTLEALADNGFVQTDRAREMLEHNGHRIDRLVLSYFSEAWIDRLGHPMQIPTPASGSGEAMPVPPSSIVESDPPKQAVAIGKRVYLRPEEKDDVRYFVEGTRQETETFWGIGRELHTAASWGEFLSSTHGEDFPDKIFLTACLRENDEVIGSVGIADIDYVHRHAETGSIIHKQEHRGLGYGFEAKHLLLEYAFNTLGLHVVTSYVNFPNTRSAAALRKQGYTESGRCCWQYPFKGGFGNMISFDLLATEWRALPREGTLS